MKQEMKGTRRKRAMITWGVYGQVDDDDHKETHLNFVKMDYLERNEHLADEQLPTFDSQTLDVDEVVLLIFDELDRHLTFEVFDVEG